MTTRIHLSLRVSDLARSIDFYTTLFSEGPDKSESGYARFMPADTPILLSLMPGAGEGGGRLDHLGLRLADKDALNAAAARLEGHVLRTEEATTCCLAVQDKLWLADPDGHAWEVYIVTDEQPAVPRVTQSTCCA